MKKILLSSLMLHGLLLTSAPQRIQAQTNNTSSAIPWFTVQNKALVVQNGSTIKPLGKDVTLPNGIRVEYRTQSILLANGTRVALREGDMLSLNGEFIQKSPVPVTVTAATTAVAASALTPAAAGALTMPAAAVKTPGAAAVLAPFTYRPAAPVNGKLKGVVELGSSGFNMFIIRVDAKRNWKLEKSEFGNSLVMEKMATEDDIRNGLKAYISQMFDFGVAGRDIHFVVSSGAATSDVTRRIVKSLEALKYVVNTVTPEREGALGLRVAMLPGFADKAFVFDMGSGNSKVAWLENGKPRVADTYGSKYYQNNTNDAVVAADVAAKVKAVPTKLRGTCFVLGGVPYELAKTVRQGQEPYTVLRAPEAYPQLTGAKNKAGLNIYQAVAAATGCQQFVFGYDVNFTIGYLLSLP